MELSKEQQIIAAAEKLVRCKGRYHGEQNYRALAALFGVTVPDLPPLEEEQQPVAVIDQANLDYLTSGSDADVWPANRKEMGDIPLYLHPQQGKAVQVPDEADPRDAFEKAFPLPAHVSRCGKGYAVHEYNAWSAQDYVKTWEGWSACRAAMLTNEPVSNRDELKSPAIPDGWVLLPAEPTQTMMNAWLSEVANWRGHADGYRAMIAAAPKPEVK